MHPIVPSQILICLALPMFAMGEETVNVVTPLGTVKGLKIKSEDTGDYVFEFRGIPYGKPAVGKLRFNKPEPFGKWEGILDGTKFMAACPQDGIDYIPELYRPEMSEDCLGLNIHVPKNLTGDAQNSVMVWIHGGGLYTGHGHQYDGGRIATVGDVIVVTINYRLGVFGFLSTNHPSARGNWGLWDQHLALQWVHDNIAAFGGDPESVTLFGQSAGSTCVAIQSVNPLNKGLFQRAIAQSGSISGMVFQQRSLVPQYIKTLSNQTKCSSENLYNFIDCLRAKTVSEVLTTTNQFSSLPTDRYKFDFIGVVVDGDFFPDHPLHRLEDKNSEESKFFGSLDFMTGIMSNEGSLLYMGLSPGIQQHYNFSVREGIPTKLLCQGLIDPFVSLYFNNNKETKAKLCNYYSSNDSVAQQSMKATDFYADIMFNYGTMKLLERHSLLGGNTFQYIFPKISPMPFGGPPPSWFNGSGHGDELLYLFDINKYLALLQKVVLSENDKDFSIKMIQYWTSFTKYGLPDGGEGTLPWKQFDMQNKTFLNFDVPLTEENNYKPDMVDFWSNQLPQIEVDTFEVGPSSSVSIFQVSFSLTFYCFSFFSIYFHVFIKV